MPFTFNDRQKSVAFFLLTGVFFALILIVLVVSGSDLVAFKQKQFTYFTDSHGFTGGTAIKFKGFNVGKVSKINLTTDNKIKVDLYFYKKYAYLIRQDSVLKVQSSLLGSSSLILITGDGIESELLEPKSLIYSSDMPEGQAVLKIYEVSGGSGEEITDKVKIILDDIHNLAPSINSTLTSLTGTMDHVSTLVSGIEKRKEIEQMTELLRSTLSELRVLIATVKKAFGK